MAEILTFLTASTVWNIIAVVLTIIAIFSHLRHKEIGRAIFMIIAVPILTLLIGGGLRLLLRLMTWIFF
ncbi:MAG: hypothetical protein FWC79_01595 [Oscillospiraceae bacterium]|nr:hypothetical protein [Oscillospiraceae bacterium]